MNRVEELAEELKGLLATIKSHFEPSMSLSNPNHTYMMIKDALNITWDICDSLETTITEREKDIIKLIVEGHSNGEIGEKLFICEKTVKFHTSSIYKKMKIKSRSQLIVEYYKNELAKVQRDKEIMQPEVEKFSTGVDRGRGEFPSNALPGGRSQLGGVPWGV